MNHFKVDADFYLTHEVDLDAFVRMLANEFAQSSVEQIHRFKIDAKSADSIEIEFFVESNSYREANLIAKKYISSIGSEIDAWLDKNSLHSKVADESLLLMQA